MIFAVMTKYFPAPGALRDYCNNVPEYADAVAKQAFLPEQLLASLEKTGRTPVAGDVKYMFHTQSGPGPISQPQSEALLSPQTGLPVPAGPRHKQMKVTSTVTPTPTPIPLSQPVSVPGASAAAGSCSSSSSGKCCPFSPSNLLFAAVCIGAGVVIGGKLNLKK